MSIESEPEPVATNNSRGELLRWVPTDGTSIGNTTLLRSLGWERDDYFSLRDSLVAEGVLKLGHGRGGSIRLANRDEDAVEHLKREFLEELPNDGSGVANRGVRERLGWTDEQYEFVKEALLAGGLIEPNRGGGAGGSIRRAAGAAEVAELLEAMAPSERLPRGREIELYPEFMEGLRGWASGQGWTQHEVEQIAHQGRRATGGTWTRPDFVVVAYKTYDYTFGRTRDIETFEVKLSDCPIEAVFEAAAHSRFATKSHLAIQRSGQMPTESDLGRIESECHRFGVGLVLFTKAGDPSNWDFRVKPPRREPDPAYVEDFLRQQISANTQQKLRHWLH